MKLFRFLPTHGGSRYLRTSHGARGVDPGYLKQVAQAADQLGCEGLRLHVIVREASKAALRAADALIAGPSGRPGPLIPITFTPGTSP